MKNALKGAWDTTVIPCTLIDFDRFTNFRLSSISKKCPSQAKQEC